MSRRRFRSRSRKRREFVLVLGGLILFAALGMGALALLDAMSGGSSGSSGALDAWAAQMRGQGYEIGYGAVATKGNVTTVSDFKLASPPDAIRWRIGAQQLQLLEGDGGRIAVQLSGPQSFTYAAGATERSFAITSRGSQFELTQAEGRIARVVATLTGLSATPAAGEPVTANRIQITLARAPGAGLIPEKSGVSLQIEKLVLPELQSSAVGRTLETLTAEFEVQGTLSGPRLPADLAAWRQSPEGLLKVNRGRFSWGMLNFEADGAIGLDAEFRPEGEVRARIKNLVAALDAFHTHRRLDPSVRADYYAALLEEMALTRTDVTEFALRMRGGTAALSRDRGGLAELTLGALPPLLPQ